MLKRCQILCSQLLLKELKKQKGIRYEIKCRNLLFHIMIYLSFVFKENHLVIEEEENPRFYSFYSFYSWWRWY